MDFGQLKDMFSSLVGTVTEKGKEYAGTAVDKTKAAGRIAKLTLELNSEKEALKKAFAEIGQAYYENCRGDAQGLFVQLCEEADAVQARVKAAEEELAELKANLSSSQGNDVEVTFEEVVEEDEKQGADILNDAAEKVEEAAGKIEEAVDEILHKDE